MSPPPPKPRKITITATTWSMVLNKRQARNDLHSIKRQQQRSLLHACFIGWRDGPLDFPTRSRCAHVLAEQDKQLAVALNRFRILGRAVCRALRADDLNFYSSLSSEAADFSWTPSSQEVLVSHQTCIAPTPAEKVATCTHVAPTFR